jgi:small nuclear ribonucleoprotein (snRNP)-like protein
MLEAFLENVNVVLNCSSEKDIDIVKVKIVSTGEARVDDVIYTEL